MPNLLLTSAVDTVAVAADLTFSVNGAASTPGDTYVVDGAGGIDTLDLSPLTYAGAMAAFDLTATAAGILSLTNAGGVIKFDNFESIVFSNNLTIKLGTAAADTIVGGGLDDKFLYGLGGDDSIDGGLGADTMYGDGGNDTYIVDNALDNVVEAAGAGSDEIRSSVTLAALAANVEDLTLIGASAIDGTGNVLANVITGNASANRLDGGGGIDTLVGGAGDDIYIIDTTTDTITELGTAGGGIDTVQSSVTYTLGLNVENLILAGTGVIDGTGNLAANTITGNAKANTLSGGAGDDTLDGGGGVDELIGGADDDTYIVDTTTDTITELGTAGGGIDLVQSSVTFTLGSNVENLTLTGTAAVDGTGNLVANVITGNSANNRLDGGGGVDTLIGGDGDDIYVVNTMTDIITELSGGGTDTVRSSVTLSALAANVENLTLTGTSAIDGTGNGLANAITGNSGNNTLNAGAGDDTLGGGGGVDTLDGGAGIDTLVLVGIADDYNPTVISAAQSKIVDSVANRDGTLTIQGIEFLKFSDGTLSIAAFLGISVINGTAGNDVLAGTSVSETINGLAGDDTLGGSAGSDTLVGGNGDDIFIVNSAGDVVVEGIGAATDKADRVSSSIAIGSLWTNVENLTLTGTANINGTGNSLDNVIIGNTGNNTLSGLAGDDTLDGGGGIDSLVGGAGNDIYILDVAGDTITEAANGGVDLAKSSVTLALLDANVENLTLTGLANVNGGGNDLDNTIIGNSGNNTLSGGAGDDTLDGGGGTDILKGEAGDDIYLIAFGGVTVTEIANGGTDTVRSSISFSLDDNIENLVLTGTSAINGSGNRLANTMTGNSANNQLSGGGGADVLKGGNGNDVYIVDSTDTVVEGGDQGEDEIQAGFTVTALATNVENLTLLEGGAFDGTGNGGNNIITGNSSNNQLYGAGGTDRLVGGRGNDVYVIDSGSDTIVENAGEGIDTVKSYLSQAYLADNTENLVLAGSGISAGYGNDAWNVITGSDGANSIDGGGGNDDMAGGKGDDIYVVDSTGDVVREKSGQGLDTIITSVTLSSLAENVEALDLMGNQSIGGTGNSLDNVITGNSGNNRINGGSGADKMSGGSGDDVYYVDTIRDRVSEFYDQGTDRIVSRIDTSLGANVENLTIAGGALKATGNGLANIIVGNVHANVITGAGGSDDLRGGSGKDTFVYRSIGDSNSSSGVDTIRDFTHASDKIDLSKIDANGNRSGNGSFDYIGGSSFDGSRAQLHLVKEGVSTMIEGDVNGDRIADFTIVLSGLPKISGSDFIL